ncbi:MAG: hypothetical protein RSH26_06885, partial [Clostridia bacterium]
SSSRSWMLLERSMFAILNHTNFLIEAFFVKKWAEFVKKWTDFRLSVTLWWLLCSGTQGKALRAPLRNIRNNASNSSSI